MPVRAAADPTTVFHVKTSMAQTSMAQTSMALAERPAIEVLVLDDSRFDAAHLARDCRETNLPVTITVVTALKDFETVVSSQRFDLVFVDFNLPDGDGLVACDILRAASRNTETPVVMITGDARHDIAVAAIKGGCADYLSKDGLNVDTLRDVIQSAIAAVGGMSNDNMVGLDDGIVAAIRKVLHEEFREIPARSEPVQVHNALVAIGLLAPESVDTDWTYMLEQEETGFVFRKLRH